MVKSGDPFPPNTLNTDTNSARPWPRLLQYELCGHLIDAATGEAKPLSARLEDPRGLKHLHTTCPRCHQTPPVRRLPARECDEWP
jgi:hypothetical protein